jgi:Sulfotransferase domain
MPMKRSESKEPHGPETHDGREWPTLFHVTHYKAGSQWLRNILCQCAPDRIVQPQFDHWLVDPIRLGMIYPTVYLSRELFDQIILPPNSRRFVVIRDLRDTLVSLYFSLKVSHAIESAIHIESRMALDARDLEAGLVWVLEHKWFDQVAQIQRSWCDSQEVLIRFEDLLERDQEILERVLLEQCGVPVERERLRQIVQANRFENLSGGRSRGSEDVSSHWRKGIAGDWRNYFTDQTKNRFKKLFGEILIETGYVNDDNW